MYVTQYERGGTRAGVGITFTAGSYTAGSGVVDQDSQPMTADGIHDTWHFRRIDLSLEAGKYIQSVYLITDGETAPGTWEAYFQDFVLVSADGTVRPIYTREQSASIQVIGTSGESGAIYTIDHGTGVGALAFATTNYYHEDHLGTSRLMTSSGGWPVWQGTFLPYGQEWNPQIGMNHYKFTGKERDSESGLDFFGARFYSSTMGRFTSPDWSDPPMPVPYADLRNPQSLNLYAYVLNNPLSKADEDGHCCEGVERLEHAAVSMGQQMERTSKQVVESYAKAMIAAGKAITGNPNFDPKHISEADIRAVGAQAALMIATDGAGELFETR